MPEPGLTLPGVPPEYFMTRSFGAAMPSGEVRYHPPSSRVSPHLEEDASRFLKVVQPLPVLGNEAVFNIAPVNISWWKMQ